ncbi:MAG TPA: glycoside hydrolase family 3 N-terminal domain-containing protein [Pseudonocardia sp.]|nr:glycoside hydrolase family 3 N-terminal domain-containing protein [Pseudonocardia sp.]
MRTRSERPAGRRRPAGHLLAGLLAGVVLAAAGVVTAVLPLPEARATGPTAAAPPVSVPPPEPAPEGALGPDRLPACAAVVEAMSPRARLAQRLVAGVDAADPRAVAELVRTSQIGGIFLGGNATALLTGQALRGVQAMARVPVSVAVDDEGGRVQRVDVLDGELPSARRMAATLSADEVRDLGRERGRALALRGVTVNYAPVVDLGGPGVSAAIGDRAFGEDPQTVARYAAAFAEGQREAGVYTVVKHFPGHGRAAGDSHLGRVTTPALDELRAADLLPYAELVGPGGPLADGRTGVMVGHLDVPGLTDELPTSLSPAAYTLLREEYGFDGLVVTDDLGAMRAISAQFDLPDAVVRALAAGADAALWSDGGRVAEVLDTAEQALADGRLDPVANDRAVTRVLTAKGVCS